MGRDALMKGCQAPISNPYWRQREQQAQKEKQIRDIKDLCGMGYMGKNE